MPSFQTMLVAALLVLPLASVAQDDGTQVSELADLNAQRAAIEQRFKAQSEVCGRRFFVNACLDEAKVVRKAELEPLQTREAAIDAKQRRARAEAQRQRVAERELEFAAAEGRSRTAELLQPAAASAPAPAQPRVRPASAPTQQKQQAKSTQAQDEARRRQAQKARYQNEQALRQQEAERRQALNQEKLKGKKPAMTLPIPSAAEIEAAGSAASGAKR